MKRLLLIGSVLCLCFLMVGTYTYYSLLDTYWQRPGPSEKVETLWIPEGTPSQDIIVRLQSQNIIAHPWLYRLFALRFGELTRYQAGEYAFPAHASPAHISRMLATGDILHHSITIPEGWLSSQIVAALQANPILQGDIHAVPPEGTLLPETYFFVRGQSRAALLARMQAAMQTTLTKMWELRQPDLPLASPQEALILASIVEKETGMAEERPQIAAVFVNRLRAGMKLQSDPTANYGLYLEQGQLKTRLSGRDVTHISNYNTYLIHGLPPSPICNPGKASIQAVLSPATTDAFYFVADGNGGHRFAKDLAEHQRNIAKYRQFLLDTTIP